ncbi:hypothetical protein AVEN_158137-1 [Araneus ventricosus]|uniref:Uncharacterized protein n=1 Tax=Araneus ventricosus TaxID=182803 RepID=A0A4Y2Q338_ARAVE|nr:hypothetical protein AVEN_158137-1 [Araneus ventricosus]
MVDWNAVIWLATSFDEYSLSPENHRQAPTPYKGSTSTEIIDFPYVERMVEGNAFSTDEDSSRITSCTECTRFSGEEKTIAILLCHKCCS